MSDSTPKAPDPDKAWREHELAQLRQFRSLTLRARLEVEAKELTDIGNSHLIRHYEVKQVPVIDIDHVDYLFHRLFAMIQLMLRKKGP